MGFHHYDAVSCRPYAQSEFSGLTVGREHPLGVRKSRNRWRMASAPISGFSSIYMERVVARDGIEPPTPAFQRRWERHTLVNRGLHTGSSTWKYG
jgi:hypothetical protein